MRQAMNRFDRPRQLFAVSLAGLAGFVDAAGFLSANGYFVSFMSGNTTRLAVDLATGLYSAIVPALLIIGFIIGVASGGVVADKAGIWRKPSVLALVAALLMVAAILHAWGYASATLAALVMAMGALNNTFLRGGEIAIGLTYMTGALVKIGQGVSAALLGKPMGNWRASLALWMGLLVGAVAGALAWSHWQALCLWLAVAWALAMMVIALKLPAET